MRVTKIRLKIMEIGGPQYLIAKRAGVPRSVLSDYVMGKRDISPKHIVPLCEVLECNPRDILGWEGDEEPVTARRSL